MRGGGLGQGTGMGTGAAGGVSGPGWGSLLPCRPQQCPGALDKLPLQQPASHNEALPSLGSALPVGGDRGAERDRMGGPELPGLSAPTPVGGSSTWLSSLLSPSQPPSE